MSNTPLVNTMRRPAARCSRTNATRPASSRTRLTQLLETHVAGESPRVPRTIDPYILHAGLHPERVQQPMVVVRIAVDLVHGDVDFVRALDQVERFDRERRFG